MNNILKRIGLLWVFVGILVIIKEINLVLGVFKGEFWCLVGLASIFIIFIIPGLIVYWIGSLKNKEDK